MQSNTTNLTVAGTSRWSGALLKFYDSAERNVSLGTSATTAQLEAIANSINTVAKYFGKRVMNTDTGKQAFATGGADSDTWDDAQGVTLHTPV